MYDILYMCVCVCLLKTYSLGGYFEPMSLLRKIFSFFLSFIKLLNSLPVAINVLLRFSLMSPQSKIYE